MKDTFTNKLGRLKNKFISGIFFLFGILLILTAAAVVCFQLFLFLQNGAWTTLPILRLIEYTPVQFYAWILEPDSWLGLHKIIYWILDVPLSFFCFILGYLLIKISDLLALFSD